MVRPLLTATHNGSKVWFVVAMRTCAVLSGGLSFLLSHQRIKDVAFMPKGGYWSYNRQENAKLDHC